MVGVDGVGADMGVVVTSLTLIAGMSGRGEGGGLSSV